MKKYRCPRTTEAFKQAWENIPSRIIAEIKVELQAILDDKNRWRVVPHQRFKSTTATGKELVEFSACGKTANALVEVTFLQPMADTVEWLSLTVTKKNK